MARKPTSHAMALVLVSMVLGAASFGLPGDLLVPVAHAEELFGPSGQISLLPAGEIVGDGVTPVDYHFLALNPDGSPMTGMKAKVSANGGSCGEVAEKGNGLYRFNFTPPQASSSRQIDLTVKGKTAAGKALTPQTFQVQVGAPHSHRMALTANPSQVVLQQDTSSTITIQLDAQPGESLADVNLDVKSSAGEIQNLTNLGGGTFTALYVPPRVNFPHLAIITAVDQNDPSRTYGFLTIPLVGKTNFPVNGVPPKANVVLRVAERDFGPMPTDATGKVSVPVMVPPGIQKATVLVSAEGKTTQRIEDLKVPDAKRLKLFPVQPGVPSDERLHIPVRVAVSTPDGKPSAGAQVQISASSGTVTAPVHEGNGVYRIDFTPPTGTGGQEVTFAASLANEPGVQTDTARIKLVSVRPTSVALSSDPKVLPVGATGFKLLVQAAGPGNLALTGRRLVLVANGAKQRGDVKDLRGGDYQAMFDTTGTGPVEVTATVQTESTGNPMWGLVAVPMADRLLNDGLSSVMITIVAVDHFGYPVANVPVNVAILAGDGSIPGQGTTNEAGIAQLYYTAGRKAGVVHLQVTAGTHTAALALFQGPAALLPDLKQLPRSGAASSTALISDWAAIVKSVKIERENALPAVTGVPAGLTGKAGPLANLAVVAEPSSVAAGGSVSLKIKAEDAEGRGVGGQKLDILPNMGSVGALQETGNGEYRVTLSVPSGAVGEVRVSVVGADGAVSRFMKVPVLAAGSVVPVALPPPPPEPVTNPWDLPPEPAPAPAAPVATPVVAPPPAPATPTAPATTPAAPAEPAPVVTLAPSTTSTAKVKKPKTPSEVKHPWFRARFGVGSSGYNYSYSVQEKPRPFSGVEGNPTPYKDSLEVSGEDLAAGGDKTPMMIPTLDARLEGWVPAVPYVGLEARYRYIWYGVQTDSFAQAHEGVDLIWYGDNLITVTPKARYFYDSGDNRYSVGVFGGFIYTAIPVVVLKTDELGQQGLWFFPWSFGSFYGGGEVGAELGMGLDAKLSYAVGTEEYSGIFAHDLSIEASYEVVNHLSLTVGYNALERSVVVPDDTTSSDPGTMLSLEDSRRGVFLGVGTSF